jgi:hypothetical protein
VIRSPNYQAYKHILWSPHSLPASSKLSIASAFISPSIQAIVPEKVHIELPEHSTVHQISLQHASWLPADQAFIKTTQLHERQWGQRPVEFYRWKHKAGASDSTLITQIIQPDEILILWLSHIACNIFVSAPPVQVTSMISSLAPSHPEPHVPHPMDFQW